MSGKDVSISKAQIPTILTVSRIATALLLPVVERFSGLFVLLYLWCGISDILDGWLARKWNCCTDLGAKLDSIADMVLTVVLICIIIPLLALHEWMVMWLVAVVAIRLLALTIGSVKYRTPAFLHTYSSKVTGIALFCFPLFYFTLGLNVTAFILCFIASYSAIEELIIMVLSKQLDFNIRGLFDR